MSSSRLPGKVLKDLAGRPMIWHIYKRAESCKYVDKVIVATSVEQSDDILSEYCLNSNLNIFRGNLNNVLDRYIQILTKENYKYFVRITGDCPLIHPHLIDSQIEALNNFDGDIVWAPTFGSIYEGQGVLSSRLLRTIYNKTDTPLDLEHVGSNYLVNHPQEFRIVDFKIPKNLIFKNIRITIDEENDYKLIQLIYNNLWKEEIIELKEVIRFLLVNQKIKVINKKIKHKEYNINVEKIKSTWSSIKKVGAYYYQDNLLD